MDVTNTRKVERWWFRFWRNNLILKSAHQIPTLNVRWLLLHLCLCTALVPGSRTKLDSTKPMTLNNGVETWRREANTLSPSTDAGSLYPLSGCRDHPLSHSSKFYTSASRVLIYFDWNIIPSLSLFPFLPSALPISPSSKLSRVAPQMDSLFSLIIIYINIYTIT